MACQPWCRLFDKITVVIGVTPMGDDPVPVQRELTAPVLPDQLQQPEPGLGTAIVLAYHQRLGHQSGQHIDDLDLIQAGSAHLGDCSPGEAAAEHRESLEDQLFGGAQPLIGPADHGVHQFLLTAGARRLQDAEFALEGVGQLMNGQHIGPGSGQFQGQRQPVKPLADANDGVRRRLVEPVVDQ